MLNKLIAVYEKVEDIRWNELPNKFAIKCTHGCGYNILTKNKNQLDREDVCCKLNIWLKQKFGKRCLELHYDKIKPRIIVEEYIENSVGLLPIDYKIYCFNGKPHLVLVCSEREKELKLDFFDLDWKKLNIGHESNQSNSELARPNCLNEMIQHAKKLATPFPFVRVDFYDNDGKPILGEMTFTPAANMANYYNEYGLNYLGGLLKLPKSL